MRKLFILFPITFLLTIISCGEKAVELIPGQIYDQGAGTWYEVFDAGMGDKSVEGTVNLNQLNSKVDEEGYPVALLAMEVEYVYRDENNDEQRVVILDSDTAKDGSNVAINIETGHYALKGLPSVDVSKNGTVVVSIFDHHWLGPDHESYSITVRYPASTWNAADSPFKMPSAEYRLADPTISLTVNLKYHIDEAWQKQEDPSSYGTYTEKTYDELVLLGNLSVKDYVSGVSISNDNTNRTLAYSAGMQLSLGDLKAQKVVLTGIAGGHYDQVVAGIIFNGEVYGNYSNFPDTYFLSTGNTPSATVNIYIPHKE